MFIHSPPRWTQGLVPGTCLWLTLVAAAPALAQTGFPSHLDSYIEQGMAAWQIPGLALAVVRDDSVIYVRGYGVRAIDSDEPVDGHTMFAVASITKAFTATALGLLVEEGIIDWDDPVQRYLPEFQLYDPWITRHVTIRDLLSHRTGYPGWAADHLWQGSDYDAEEVLRRFRYQPTANGFRTRYGYSNIMYLAAGNVIPVVTGEPWSVFVTKRLLEPLGMEETTLSITALEQRENVASPHIMVDGEPTSVPWYDAATVAPAMALNTSAADLACWMRLHLARGILRGDTLVAPRIIDDLQSPQIWYDGPTELAALEERAFSAYGLGWDLFDYRGRKVVRHSGSLDGMTSLITMVPRAGLGVVVLTNIVPGQFPVALTNHIVDAMLGAPETDWNEKLLELRAESWKKEKLEERYWDKSRDKSAKRSLPLGAYLGEYYDSLSGGATVSTTDHGLVFRYNSKYVGDLTHWQHDIYRVAWRDPYVRQWAGSFLIFVPDGRGGIGSLRVVFDNEVEFSKVPGQ